MKYEPQKKTRVGEIDCVGDDFIGGNDDFRLRRVAMQESRHFLVGVFIHGKHCT